jgi:aromatic ring-opening dioxygenase catalytic subunit (LigB family)
MLHSLCKSHSRHTALEPLPIWPAPSNQTTSYCTMARAPVIAVCHGGGPLPVLGDPSHQELIKSMSERVPAILGLGTSEAPRAIVLITAHWSEQEPTISNGETHKLLYDYGGMPQDAYQLKYDAPGSPQVAREIYDILAKAGFDPAVDARRGMYCSYEMQRPD